MAFLLLILEVMSLGGKFINGENAITMERSMKSRLSVFAFILICVWASPAHAWMWEVSDEVLSEVTGEGFSQFTLDPTTGVARAFFNVNAATYTEVASLKMGYYADPVSGLNGWDQDWTTVSFGSSTEDLVIKGVYLEAGFSSLTDPANRQLNYISIGTPDLTGPITADFNSFSGKIIRLDTTTNQNETTPWVNGRRISLGARTLYGNNSNFSVTLDRTGVKTGYTGWWVEMDRATVTPDTLP
ncbi:MAG: hypothetical protein LLG93_14985 [Deltaproteobacteria bacterium]|nr:hypothetical protein [Deltaproteobacteria bacterium]